MPQFHIRRSPEYPESSASSHRENFDLDAAFITAAENKGFSLVRSDSERRVVNDLFQQYVVSPSRKFALQAHGVSFEHTVSPRLLLSGDYGHLLLFDVKDQQGTSCLTEFTIGRPPYTHCIDPHATGSSASAVLLFRQKNYLTSSALHALSPEFVKHELSVVGKRGVPSFWRGLISQTAETLGLATRLTQWEASQLTTDGFFAFLCKNERGETLLGSIGGNLINQPCYTTRLVTTLQKTPAIPLPFNIQTRDIFCHLVSKYLCELAVARGFLTDDKAHTLQVSDLEMMKVIDRGPAEVGAYALLCTHQFGRDAILINGAKPGGFSFSELGLFSKSTTA